MCAEELSSKYFLATATTGFIPCISCKKRFNLENSDQDKLSEMPSIIVPSITLDGQDDGVRPPSDEKVDSDKFTGFRRHKILSGVGHNVPQEAPEIFANAILELYSHNQNL